MDFPQELRYTASHEWIRVEPDGIAAIGLTSHAGEALGDIVFVELPNVGADVTAGLACALVESVKAASDIYAPLTGKVTAINETVKNSPDTMMEAPYENWLFKISFDGEQQLAPLLSADDYAHGLE
ncbi:MULTISPECIES: glycine cleavage system protein GcvH [unclassified Caballeronia]|uniref:glycine cleavage system protein GcvH n=1 Tax=unclassified Caballeronia TaxID=2646786 RepID=UPI001F23DAC0|nr:MULTISPECIES: glycine cleavage system protein GcvH [unclassified Caballeronia]MCE4547315.1 glycine cleavage system protein GcvH [Caballeronia sp. PC1]MCE4575298.1 glycine cleavage system protein GcvH [Caballeronia sp. CLC5]